MATYKWIRGMDGMPRVSAQVVGTELARLEKDGKGKLLPKAIVKAAKPKKSKLHDCFEWDNTAAAKKYRERQASEMLRKIHIVYEESKTVDDEPKTIRAFVNIAPDTKKGEGYYCDTRKLTKRPELHENVLAQILAELNAIKHKAAQYKLPELQAIWNAIDATIQQRP